MDPEILTAALLLAREQAGDDPELAKALLQALAEEHGKNLAEAEEPKHKGKGPGGGQFTSGSGGGGEVNDKKHPADKEKEDSEIRFKVPPEMDDADVQEASVEGIKKAVDGFEEYTYYGLRQLHDGEGGPLTPTIGEALQNSWTWDDDQKTDEELEGTSTIGFDPNDEKSIEKALDKMTRYSLGTLVVVGSDRTSTGQDPGEELLRNPIVISALGRKKKEER